ncbi:AAA domain-containing protein [Actinokineospora terrae]|uniref:AAA domain-containing protein n=1 Tax=Actinokineospora terrae TaxID=155974 RepID=A0A1H9XMB8_9PSEU|nr:(d)CMP kinase [Actinokineospora terrae]SES46813.1 AAA domain-containing protein [Actinokineospora terrae]
MPNTVDDWERRRGHPLGVEQVAAAVRAAPPRLGRVRLVAIDGPSGSGKSTYAAELAERIPDSRLVSTDDFATWDDPIAWWPRLVAGVFHPLGAGRPGRYRRTQWVNGKPGPGDWVDVPVPGTLLVEGVSSGRRSIMSSLSALIWCELPDPLRRLERAVARDGADSRAELLRWQAFESGWYPVDRTRDRASIVVLCDRSRTSSVR